eukprot:TRINITY_DN10087_c0_g1_i1.p1 TRINITY_DN10087_c0_g1~~TRINITY_DN10087_c0_g1_i1.p1  ORF type:complete len:660 (-),score=110.59 TRINITY_DN10087_c0_g1_i1:113-2092(-)
MACEEIFPYFEWFTKLSLQNQKMWNDDSMHASEYRLVSFDDLCKSGPFGCRSPQCLAAMNKSLQLTSDAACGYKSVNAADCQLHELLKDGIQWHYMEACYSEGWYMSLFRCASLGLERIVFCAFAANHEISTSAPLSAIPHKFCVLYRRTGVVRDNFKQQALFTADALSAAELQLYDELCSIPPQSAASGADDGKIFWCIATLDEPILDHAALLETHLLQHGIVMGSLIKNRAMFGAERTRMIAAVGKTIDSDEYFNLPGASKAVMMTDRFVPTSVAFAPKCPASYLLLQSKNKRAVSSISGISDLKYPTAGNKLGVSGGAPGVRSVRVGLVDSLLTNHSFFDTYHPGRKLSAVMCSPTPSDDGHAMMMASIILSVNMAANMELVCYCCDEGNYLAGLRQAVADNCDVINCSWSFDTSPRDDTARMYLDLLDDAHTKGLIVNVSAGNVVVNDHTGAFLSTTGGFMACALKCNAVAGASEAGDHHPFTASDFNGVRANLRKKSTPDSWGPLLLGPYGLSYVTAAHVGTHFDRKFQGKAFPFGDGTREDDGFCLSGGSSSAAAAHSAAIAWALSHLRFSLDELQLLQIEQQQSDGLLIPNFGRLVTRLQQQRQQQQALIQLYAPQPAPQANPVAAVPTQDSVHLCASAAEQVATKEISTCL